MVSLTTQFAHLSDSTAELGTPAVVVLAISGYGLSLRWKPRIDGWLVASAIGVFAVFAAPVLLSGRATFLSYIKLDDTATYLEMLDRAMHHGYNAAGLGLSTYEASLKSTYTPGYPLGSLQPLGVGQALVGTDPAWLWQPYVTFLGVLVGLGLYQLVSGLVRSRLLRAVVAFGGAQAALIYGYALWGGIKELATSALAVAIACLVPMTIANRHRIRSVLPLAATSACVLACLTVQGAVWLAVPLAAAALILLRTTGVRESFRTAGSFLIAAVVLAIPALAAAGPWLAQAAVYTTEGEYANLVRRLNWIQAFGIWPNGDFRTPPSRLDVTYVLVAVVAAAAATTLVFSYRRRAWEIPVALATAAFACVVYVGLGSPWIGGKALASSAPIIFGLALAAAAMFFELGRRVEGLVLGGVLLAGVLWSNVLQYRAVILAPNERLAELEEIGKTHAGEGPTLMTEYEPYGARHFLRRMDTEAASELRRNTVPLRAGGVADQGVSADIDEFELDAVLHYRTLVLRRSAVASRPPSDYRLISKGHSYEVWQRSDQLPTRIIEHVSLGSRLRPAAAPACADVMRLARLARANNGLIATVLRPPPTRDQYRWTLGGSRIVRPVRGGSRGPVSDRAVYDTDDLLGPISRNVRDLGGRIVPCAPRDPDRRKAGRFGTASDELAQHVRFAWCNPASGWQPRLQPAIQRSRPPSWKRRRAAVRTGSRCDGYWDGRAPCDVRRAPASPFVVRTEPRLGRGPSGLSAL